ncbi:MAG TPA: S41 family peptidase [Candidatus Paceibacterota bacterium]|nr:S41 family peptidase [Candidatus Paceibacterota bacterium]
MQSVSTRFIVAGALVLVSASFASGFLVGSSPKAAHMLPASVAQAIGAEQPPEGVDFSPVWRAWAVLDEKFVPASVATTTGTSTKEAAGLVEGTPEQQRVWGMIQGMAESLGDPYTFFLPPVEQKQFEEDLSGEFTGVGMEIAIKNEVPTVVSPLKGTPAERAGIKPNDQILEIDGLSTRGMDIATAVNRIRGPKGTDVTLKMIREGWIEPRDIKVTRDVINIPVIDTEHRSDGIYVISVHNFTSNSPLLFRGALRSFIESGSTRLILDLRGNPGGYLEAAVDMASWFLPLGQLVVTEDYAGNQSNVDHRSRGYNVFNDNLRMVILVDKGSASASEILAGALRYHGRAELVGTNTFGKGSVQELVPITDDTGLKVTVARWLMPSGAQIPTSGIAPDYEVAITEEDIEAGDDPQMERAVELLR